MKYINSYEYWDEERRITVPLWVTGVWDELKDAQKSALNFLADSAASPWQNGYIEIQEIAPNRLTVGTVVDKIWSYNVHVIGGILSDTKGARLCSHCVEDYASNVSDAGFALCERCFSKYETDDDFAEEIDNPQEI